jgi:hypothetical protein
MRSAGRARTADGEKRIIGSRQVLNAAGVGGPCDRTPHRQRGWCGVQQNQLPAAKRCVRLLPPPPPPAPTVPLAPPPDAHPWTGRPRGRPCPQRRLCARRTCRPAAPCPAPPPAAWTPACGGSRCRTAPPWCPCPHRLRAGPRPAGWQPSQRPTLHPAPAKPGRSQTTSWQVCVRAMWNVPTSGAPPRSGTTPRGGGGGTCDACRAGVGRARHLRTARPRRHLAGRV